MLTTGVAAVIVTLVTGLATPIAAWLVAAYFIHIFVKALNGHSPRSRTDDESCDKDRTSC